MGNLVDVHNGCGSSDTRMPAGQRVVPATSAPPHDVVRRLTHFAINVGFHAVAAGKVLHAVWASVSAGARA
jgi:hypothetical protein